MFLFFYNAGCRPRTYGENCSFTCGQCNNGEACDVSSGACAACKTNFVGSLCQGKKKIHKFVNKCFIAEVATSLLFKQSSLYPVCSQRVECMSLISGPSISVHDDELSVHVCHSVILWLTLVSCVVVCRFILLFPAFNTFSVAFTLCILFQQTASRASTGMHVTGSV